MLALSLLVVSLSLCLQALDLPPYIQGCKKGSDLNECSVKNGNEAWSTIIKGDPKYKIPVLSPLKVDKLQVSNKASKNVQLDLTMTDVIINGLETVKVKNARFDLSKKYLEIDATLDYLAIVGKYKINGKFLVLPIIGNGPANITIKDLDLLASVKYSLHKKGGEEYIKIDEANIKYDTSRLYAHFENLFDGNKELSDNMNTVIDENWKAFNEDMGPAIGQALAGVYKQVLANIVTLVPYNKIFL